MLILCRVHPLRLSSLSCYQLWFGSCFFLVPVQLSWKSEPIPTSGKHFNVKCRLQLHWNGLHMKWLLGSDMLFYSTALIFGNPHGMNIQAHWFWICILFVFVCVWFKWIGFASNFHFSYYFDFFIILFWVLRIYFVPYLTIFIFLSLQYSLYYLWYNLKISCHFFIFTLSLLISMYSLFITAGLISQR